MFPKYLIRTLLFCCVFFILIPVLIYTFSYLPFSDGTGNGLVARMIKNAHTMFDYHSKLVSTHPYSSHWYQWPVMYRPIYYYQHTISTTVSEAISSFGNPLVWWAGIPAFIFMGYLIIHDRDKKAGFITVAYLSQLLPWVGVSRTTYIYHYFPSVPFVVLMVGYSMYKIIEMKPKWKYAVYLYTAVTVGLFIAYYPVIAGQPAVKQNVMNWLKWFESWVLIS